jgi:hypothetical protein
LDENVDPGETSPEKWDEPQLHLVTHNYNAPWLLYLVNQNGPQGGGIKFLYLGCYMWGGVICLILVGKPWIHAEALSPVSLFGYLLMPGAMTPDGRVLQIRDGHIKKKGIKREVDFDAVREGRCGRVMNVKLVRMSFLRGCPPPSRAIPRYTLRAAKPITKEILQKILGPKVDLAGPPPHGTHPRGGGHSLCTDPSLFSSLPFSDFQTKDAPFLKMQNKSKCPSNEKNVLIFTWFDLFSEERNAGEQQDSGRVRPCSGI